MRTTPRVLALLGAVAIGCGPSASYDGLTGGSRPAESSSPTLATSEMKEDDTFAPPRPVAPISVSVVASPRPQLRWENVDGAIGVVVELSKKRTFPAAETKTFPLDGEQADVPEDLDGGMWFWRLRSRAAGRLGKTSSPIWQMYVRGPMKAGASRFASGSIVDVNGDGLADFLAAADETMDTGVVAPVVNVFEGQADGTFARSLFIGWDGAQPGLPVSISGGADVDGDGLSDFVHAGVAHFTEEPRDADAGAGAAPVSRLPVIVELGSTSLEGPDRSYDVPSLEPSSVPTSVAMAGDVNGDGYGDVLHLDRDDVVLSFGGPKGLGTQTRLLRASSSGLFPMAGGFDANGDGLADFVHRADERGDKASLSLGLGDRDFAFGGPFPLLPTSEPGFEARAIVSGDFDGDGVADLAVSEKKTDGTSSGLVCVFLANKAGGMMLGGCVAGARTDLDFGLAITTVDLDGDGRDELLVGVRDGSGLRVDALRPEAGSVIVEELAHGVGAALSTLEPGRMGSPGRWLASNGGDEIRVYAGRDEAQSIPAPRGAKGFGRSLR